MDTFRATPSIGHSIRSNLIKNCWCFSQSTQYCTILRESNISNWFFFKTNKVFGEFCISNTKCLTVIFTISKVLPKFSWQYNNYFRVFLFQWTQYFAHFSGVKYWKSVASRYWTSRKYFFTMNIAIPPFCVQKYWLFVGILSPWKFPASSHWTGSCGVEKATGGAAALPAARQLQPRQARTLKNISKLP